MSHVREQITQLLAIRRQLCRGVDDPGHESESVNTHSLHIVTCKVVHHWQTNHKLTRHVADKDKL